MRVIVIGRKRTVQKLVAFLAEEGIDAVGTSDGLDKMMVLQKQDMFDLAIVDSVAGEAEAVCQYIKGSWAIPLVLLVSKRQGAWKNMQALDVAGYLHDEVGNSELVARMRAMLRRFPIYGCSTGG